MKNLYADKNGVDERERKLQEEANRQEMTREPLPVG